MSWAPLPGTASDSAVPGGRGGVVELITGEEPGARRIYHAPGRILGSPTVTVTGPATVTVTVTGPGPPYPVPVFVDPEAAVVVVSPDPEPVVVVAPDPGPAMVVVVGDGRATVVDVVVDTGGVEPDGVTAGCDDGAAVVVVVSGEVQPAGALVGPCWPGIKTVPAHPKFVNVASRVTVAPSEKLASGVTSRMKPAPSMATFTVVPV